MRSFTPTLMSAPYTRLLAISCIAGLSLGFQLPIVGRRRESSSLSRRAASINGSAALVNNGDITYHTSITLNGDTFSCLIDTGSSDLWVAGTVSKAKDTGSDAAVNYAVGAAKGPIKTADLEFAGYTVPNQAFLEVTPDSDNPEGEGIIGLGPNSASNVYAGLNESDTGIAVVDRIFLQNTTTPNFITINLGRHDDPTDTFLGNITVGDILDGYEAISSQPKLDVTEVSVERAGNQHFQILLDQDGLIGPDGNPISIKTEVDETSNDYQATAIVDSGFSLTQLPKAAADAIYNRFDGAEYTYVGGVGSTWILPCELEVNITFKFSGKEYPIHPLDVSLDPSILGIDNLENSLGQACCIGLFQPFSFDTGDDPTYDMILGMSFMRNAYTLINYGDFVADDEDNEARSDPYIQLLSTTDKAEAHSDFVTIRLDGVDTTGTQELGPAVQTSKKSNLKSALIYGISGALFVIGAILIAYACFRRRRSSKRGPVYRQLASPTPPVDMSVMHHEQAPPQYSLQPQYSGQHYAPGQGELYDPQPQAGAASQAHLYDPQPGPYTSQQPVPSYHNPFEGRPQY